MNDEYKYCQDFCPLYHAIEEYNRGCGEPFSCTMAKIDCDYIVKLIKSNRDLREEKLL